MQHCFVWLRDLDTKKIRTEVFGELRNEELEENGEDKLMNKFFNVQERRGHFKIISYLENPTGLIIFWEEIASFMMPLKDR